MIRIENISKRYKNNAVLKSVSLTIKEGELVVIIGSSGCGKTTLLKMLNRLIKPTSGKIFINDEDILYKDVIALRRKMGYVIQQTGLFPHMTIRDNIEIIPKLEKKDKDDINKRTLELMEMVELNAEEYLNRYPTELSGGQQQRVGVARAFATDPDIVLMDEPFSALDPITRNGLQDELIKLHAKLKKTIVFVTHDIDEAIKIADKICIMKEGEVVQFSTPERILKQPANDFVAEFVGKHRIWTNPEYIRARDIMTPTTYDNYKKDPIITKLIKVLFFRCSSKKDLINVRADESIANILKVMDECNLPQLPVVDNQDNIIGMINKNNLVSVLNQRFIYDSKLEKQDFKGGDIC